MKVTYITAGAANMYCGACIRDNALVSEFLSRGLDIELVPLYTPTLTDETNVSLGTTFFGGINVYLQQHFSLFRSTPWALDRILDSSWVLNSVGQWGTRTDPKHLGEITVSVLQGESGYQHKELEKLLSWLQDRSHPDLIHLGNSLLSGLALPLKRALACPVCCTLQGEEFFIESLPEPHRSRSREKIRANVEFIDQFHAVNSRHAKFMREYLRIPAEKIYTIHVGINSNDFRLRHTSKSSPFSVGFLARIVPEKGLHILCEAFRKVVDELGSIEARLLVAGTPGIGQTSYLKKIRQRMKEWGLTQSFEYRGQLNRSEKIDFLRDLDVFSVPTCYDEPKGLSILEAMACGVPVVLPRRAGFTDIVERTGGGLLVEPDNAGALARGLLALQRDTGYSEKLGQRGQEGVRQHYDIHKMGDATLKSYSKLLQPSQSSGMNTGNRIFPDKPVALRVHHLEKHYTTLQDTIPVLSDISLSLSWGDAISIVGPSGSGKSTFLHILGTLELPTSGTVSLEGQNPFNLGAKELARFRNRQVGFVFQDHYLLPQCSVLENVMIPTLVEPSRKDQQEHLQRARRLLLQVGLDSRLEHRPWELSGGERQRVSLARALIMEPFLLLCDEPTGNLDHKAAKTVSDLLINLHEHRQMIQIVVTHNLKLAARFPIRYELRESHLYQQ